jgi:DNA processing protein
MTKDLPHLVRDIPAPPAQLFVEGDSFSDLLARPRIAIVGSRKISPYGRAVTEQIATAFARAGAVVVSGLALGVDSIAHQAALDARGTTMAVLPGPINKIYPASHARLARQIVEQGGALISEYAQGAGAPMKHQFIDRNRIISGLSDAVILTAAAEASGSLHTARHAHEQGKPVYAVPGPITDPGYAGNNQLIADGSATLITSPEALVKLLGLEGAHQQALILGDTPEEQGIIDLIQQGITAGDELLARSKLPVSAFDQAITMLEISGHIRNVGNGHWRLG